MRYIYAATAKGISFIDGSPGTISKQRSTSEGAWHVNK